MQVGRTQRWLSWATASVGLAFVILLIVGRAELIGYFIVAAVVVVAIAGALFRGE